MDNKAGNRAHKKPQHNANLASVVDKKAKQKLRTQGRRISGVWFGLGMMGLIGWSVAIPTLLGTLLGIWLDHKYHNQHSWTLALLLAGLCIGCFTAWNWVGKEIKAMYEENKEYEEHDE